MKYSGYIVITVFFTSLLTMAANFNKQSMSDGVLCTVFGIEILLALSAYIAYWVQAVKKWREYLLPQKIFKVIKIVCLALVVIFTVDTCISIMSAALHNHEELRINQLDL